MMNPITLAPPSLRNATTLQLLDAAAAAGFDGVGLRLLKARAPEHSFEPVIGNPALIAQIKQRLRDNGLSVLELYSFYMTPVVDFDAIAAAMEVGADLGAKYAVALGYDEDRGRMCDTFGRMCDLAKPFGLTVTLEYAPVPECRPTTLEQAVSLLREANRPNSGMMPDPAHVLRAGDAIADFKAVDPKYVPFCQICDFEVVGEEFLATLNRKVPKIRRRLTGEGILPVSEWMDALPPGIPISVETGPQPPELTHLEWATALYTTTRAALEKYYASRQGGR
jgi:sugar phosphate isomerase/epimerase